MKLYKTTAPGFPSRGWRGHAPMAPEGDGGASGAAATTTTTTTTEKPAEKAPEKPAEKPAETVAQKPATTTEKPAETKDDLASIIAAAKAEREAMAARNAELEKVLGDARAVSSRERAVERRAYVRGLQLAVPLDDESIDAMLAPLGDVDVRTEAGKTTINKWRDARLGTGLFRGAIAPPVLDVDKEIESIVGGKENVDRKIFGGRAARSMIETTKKSDFASWKE